MDLLRREVIAPGIHGGADHTGGARHVDACRRLDDRGALAGAPAPVRMEPAEDGDGRFGERERGHRRSSTQPPVDGTEHHRDDRLRRSRRRAIDVIDRSADRRRHGGRVDHEHGVDVVGLERSSHGPLVVLVVRRPVERERVARRCAARPPRRRPRRAPQGSSSWSRRPPPVRPSAVGRPSRGRCRAAPRRSAPRSRPPAGTARPRPGR